MNLHRTVSAIHKSIASVKLDLRGLNVYTEAATGAYAVTPVIAAAAGAKRVYALASSNRYGTAARAISECRRLAIAAGAATRIRFEKIKRPSVFSEIDILTNSGNVRPIDAATLAMLGKSTAVIPLMYESWEFRPSDIDLAACRRRGVAVAGTNERHPNVRFFDYLGLMAVWLMLDARFEIRGARVAVACDNSFAPYLASALSACGASVRVFAKKMFAAMRPADFKSCDAILVAASPLGEPVVFGSRTRGARVDLAAVAKVSPGVELFEFCWGGVVDRSAARRAGLRVSPEPAPHKGHMGVIPSVLGPVPLVCLQAGGLKVGEILARARLAGKSPEGAIAAVERSGYGSAIAI